MTTSIEDAWSRLAAGQVFPVHTRISADHPLDLFAQIDDRQRVGLLTLSDFAPDRVPTYAAVEVKFGKRDDGRWAMSLALTQPTLLSMFATMCNQIVEQGRALAPITDAARFVLSQVARWHRLLALGRDGLLAAEEQQGLFGELVILRQAVVKYGPDEATSGWIGPEDAPQDFELPDGPVEVKAIRAGQPFVWISSLEQLDVDADRLLLAIVDLVHVANSTGGLSLAGAVAAVREELTSAPLALQRLEEQLQRAGYVDREEYGLIEYQVPRIRWYSVHAAFPRLTRTKLPAAIASARYQLMLSELSAYETDPFDHHG